MTQATLKVKLKDGREGRVTLPTTDSDLYLSTSGYLAGDLTLLDIAREYCEPSLLNSLAFSIDTYETFGEDFEIGGELVTVTGFEDLLIRANTNSVSIQKVQIADGFFPLLDLVAKSILVQGRPFLNRAEIKSVRHFVNLLQNRTALFGVSVDEIESLELEN